MITSTLPRMRAPGRPSQGRRHLPSGEKKSQEVSDAPVTATGVTSTWPSSDWHSCAEVQCNLQGGTHRVLALSCRTRIWFLESIEYPDYSALPALPSLTPSPALACPNLASPRAASACLTLDSPRHFSLSGSLSNAECRALEPRGVLCQDKQSVISSWQTLACLN